MENDKCPKCGRKMEEGSIKNKAGEELKSKTCHWCQKTTWEKVKWYIDKTVHPTPEPGDFFN